MRSSRRRDAEKAAAFHGGKIDVQLRFESDKPVYMNHYYFYIDEEEFGTLFVKACSYSPWNHALPQQVRMSQTAARATENPIRSAGQRLLSYPEPAKLQGICDALGPEDIEERRAGFAVASSPTK
jgi:hypothetical protein